MDIGNSSILDLLLSLWRKFIWKFHVTNTRSLKEEMSSKVVEVWYKSSVGGDDGDLRFRN